MKGYDMNDDNGKRLFGYDGGNYGDPTVATWEEFEKLFQACCADWDDGTTVATCMQSVVPIEESDHFSGWIRADILAART